MAQQQLFLFFASVLHQFRLSAPDGPASVDATPIVGFNQHCPPYRVNIRPRFRAGEEGVVGGAATAAAAAGGVAGGKGAGQQLSEGGAGRKRVLRRLASNSAKELMAH